ncbi:helix-turn-helix domain-containing protein [Pseudoduganella sp. R-34]|uniref:helix-turn-helix domain-containing protein n=1 Tax=Pseudoduganella sp. R-34 TaxID=3404062 RepID=UPI003CF0AF2A
MSRYESGVHEPPGSFAEALANILNVPAAYFYCADDRLAEVILLYFDVEEGAREEILRTARELAMQRQTPPG